MVYSKKTLAKIGKVLIQKHPEIATGILSEIPTTVADLSKMPGYYLQYCQVKGIEPELLKGAAFKAAITEPRKVFVAAMITIYNDQYKFNKIISDLLEIDCGAMSRVMIEVKFRYKNDHDFRDQVTNVLENIIQ